MTPERSNIALNGYRLCANLSYKCDNTAISARSGDPDFTEHTYERQTGPKAQDSESYNARRGAGYSHILQKEQLMYRTRSCMLRNVICGDLTSLGFFHQNHSNPSHLPIPLLRSKIQMFSIHFTANIKLKSIFFSYLHQFTHPKLKRLPHRSHSPPTGYASSGKVRSNIQH